jgi:hypothetical protein
MCPQLRLRREPLAALTPSRAASPMRNSARDPSEFKGVIVPR